MADQIYLPPEPGGDILQGDIFEDMPSTFVESRPLRVARRFQRDKAGRDIWVVHLEGTDGPPGGFNWSMDRGGEDAILVHGHLGRAMVLTHDCEIENDPSRRTLAMVRPITDLHEEQQRALFSGREDAIQYPIFPLEAQTISPTMERSFVDFRRLTTARPEFLTQSMKVASLSNDLREAIAERFWQFLFRRVQAPASDG